MPAQRNPLQTRASLEGTRRMWVVLWVARPAKLQAFELQ
jgi:hypothetical protein